MPERIAHDAGASDPPPVLVGHGTHKTSAVCMAKPWTNESCYQHTFNSSDTKGFFAMPRGMRYWVDAANSEFGDGQLNHELGRNHARIPVTHTHTMQHAWQPGLWFFYMRGCSDFHWDVGRTLLVRNRCHLAAVLEQRVHRVSWSRAIGRVARKLILASNVTSWAPEIAKSVASAGASAHLMGPLGMIVGPLSGIVGEGTAFGRPPRRSVAELAQALDVCARGILPADKAVRDLALDLWMLNTLDYTSAAVLMHDMHGTVHEVDTIQFANRCSSAMNATEMAVSDVCVQPVEVWDVRAIGSGSWTPGSVPRPWSAPDGKTCPLSHSFAYCMACNDSLSERGCRYRCSMPHRGVPSHIAPSDPDKVSYGQPIGSGFALRMKQLGPLGKAEIWRSVWEKVLRQLPRLPHESGRSGQSTE